MSILEAISPTARELLNPKRQRAQAANSVIPSTPKNP